MAAASTSMAATAALLPPRAARTPVAAAARVASSLPYMPPRFSSHPAKRCSEPRRLLLVPIRASSDDTSAPVDAGELFTDLKEKWDALENKSTVILYGGGAIVAVWLSSVVVGAINSVPLYHESSKEMFLVTSFQRSWSWSGLDTLDGSSIDTFYSSRAGRN
ncbi:hypothetical protein EUGRSUZ_D02339 [Eucalyptus grandis]|uniref:Uncharacterized protein n=2 Tax=Eucalyptus grandis TaxID=71139 RepID=A0ACC3L7E4_EUCGR|nr:hypothetical protein EUGRSUZ_D02339 [Eucalyptus grandis]